MPARQFLPDGTVTAPAIGFRSERMATGFYRNASKSIAASINGAIAWAVRATSITVAAAAAATAGGAEAIRIGTGASGVIAIGFGSGAPTVSLPQGSLYLRTDGSSTSTRAYIATNGAGTWTAITTAA